MGCHSGTAQTNITGMCGECSQCMDHAGVAPAQGGVCFLGLTAQAPGCPAGELSKAGPAFCALARSKLLGFRFSGTPQRHRLRWVCISCPSQVRAAQVARCLLRALSQWAVHLDHLPGPSRVVPQVRPEHHPGCAVCLLWRADCWLRPSWEMSTVQGPRKTWLATGCWSLGLRLEQPLAFRLWLSPTCLSASGGGGPVCS